MIIDKLKHPQFINYHLLIITYEKETRTKINPSEHRTFGRIQHSYFIVIQQ